jgi:ribosomal protein L16/L10AE
MNDIEKLRVLLPHWIEHNAEHAAEFREWAERVRQAEHGDAAWEVRVAAENLEAANDALEAALEKLGGPLAHHHHKG